MVRIEQITLISAPVERCFDLARSVEVHLAGNVHFGEQALATGGDLTSGLIDLRQKVTWRAKHFGVWHELTSRITVMTRPIHFQDIMLQGPFHSMKHEHYFRSVANGMTEMRDVFIFSAPFPVLGKVVEILFLKRYMDALLRERSAVIRQIAESDDWKSYIPA